MSEPASKEMEERCDHDERDHGICLHCGKQTGMNAHDYVSEESSPAPWQKCVDFAAVADCEPEHYDAECGCITCQAKRLLSTLQPDHQK